VATAPAATPDDDACGVLAVILALFATFLSIIVVVLARTPSTPVGPGPLVAS
jgi:hypothetical protein